MWWNFPHIGWLSFHDNGNNIPPENVAYKNPPLYVVETITKDFHTDLSMHVLEFFTHWMVFVSTLMENKFHPKTWLAKIHLYMW